MFGLPGDGSLQITVLESAEIGIIGVGEGTFPTIRETSATFKQGIRLSANSLGSRA